MSETLVREIATKIFEETILHNIYFYLIFLVVSIIGGAISTFTKGLLQKKGEQFATKTDLNDLIEQIKKTTQAQEEIKTSISHIDWSNREWKKIRITKLEELLDSINTYRDEALRFQTIMMSGNLDDKKTATNTPPKWTNNIIASLYFPELENKVSELYKLISETNKQSIIFAITKEGTKMENAYNTIKNNAKNETILINDIIKESQNIICMIWNLPTINAQ
jgi:hypothetical protein